MCPPLLGGLTEASGAVTCTGHCQQCCGHRRDQKFYSCGSAEGGAVPSSLWLSTVPAFRVPSPASPGTLPLHATRPLGTSGETRRSNSPSQASAREAEPVGDTHRCGRMYIHIYIHACRPRHTCTCKQTCVDRRIHRHTLHRHVHRHTCRHRHA